jgi:hypothetical protein
MTSRQDKRLARTIQGERLSFKHTTVYRPYNILFITKLLAKKNNMVREFDTST